MKDIARQGNRTSGILGMDIRGNQDQNAATRSRRRTRKREEVEEDSKEKTRDEGERQIMQIMRKRNSKLASTFLRLCTLAITPRPFHPLVTHFLCAPTIPFVHLVSLLFSLISLSVNLSFRFLVFSLYRLRCCPRLRGRTLRAPTALYHNYSAYTPTPFYCRSRSRICHRSSTCRPTCPVCAILPFRPPCVLILSL